MNRPRPFPSSGVSRRRVALAGVVASIIASAVVLAPQHPASATGSPCGPTVNPIACENQQPGTPDSVWDVTGAGDPTIQGFSTDISVAAGSTIGFKIKTTASAYSITIYRLGYYGGTGARKVAGVSPSASLPQVQPACASNPSTSLYDCGTWALSASWTPPTTAVSGVYIADLRRTDTGGMSQISFVVRNDASASDIVYQTSDETWEAYNRYGGSDFYTGDQQNLYDSPTRARAISYNRPFITRGDNNGRDFLFSNEYPTIRYLERNGYDVSYITDMDTDRFGATQLTQHRVFLSVGHDEYWSQKQRTNVVNARDAGVNLMFLSGNEVYWHTRFAASIDGTNTPYRTLICYKDTWDSAPTDPSGESTATWRDPRFATAPGGSSPENALTGTMYKANTEDMPITVTKAQGALRVWRDTGLSSMTGASTALAPSTIGYESDEDVDNGFRPAGLIDMSTTSGASPDQLQDYGATTAAGTTTHHITLYRAASGALVFGAGTIQWGWGLDSDHDGPNNAADPRMQQATANLLADMGAQSSTPMPGLVAPTASSDTTAPIAVITSPAAGAAVKNGTPLTVTGTASDQGGGVVAGVEVSLDGGTTWHPATGTASWTYTDVVHGDGPLSVRARATDDSVNTQPTPAAVSVTVSCPCSLFGATVPGTTPGTGAAATSPATVDSGDGGSYELGAAFTPTDDGLVTGVRFYKSAGNTGTHTGTLWSAIGTQLATGTFTGETASGWQTLSFASPVPVTRNTKYVVSYYAPNGHYSAQSNYWAYSTYSAQPLQAPVDTPSNQSANGFYATSHGFPTETFGQTNYFVDVTFVDSSAGPPGVTGQTPAPGVTDVATSAAPTATFSRAISASTLTFTVKDSNGAAVAGAVSYNSATFVATFTPSSVLATGTTYTAAVGASDSSGQALTGTTTWTFTTTGPAGCPCTLFPVGAQPTTADSGDPAAVTLGVRFTSSQAGYVTGVRFYKAATNAGSHVGALWSSTGTQLASGTYSGESASGWQTLTFTTPVAVAAGTTYVASYSAPNGHYSADGGFFTSALTRGPLTAPAGTNGVYAYGSGSNFPSAAYNSTNYWVDPVLTLTPPTDTTPPTVTSVTPAPGATGAPSSAAPTVTFSEPVTSSSLAFTLKDSGGQAVAGTASYSAATVTATFVPSSALTAGATYTASVSASDTAGNAMAAPRTWSFTVASGQCPCTLFGSNVPDTPDGGDGAAVNLGVRFVPSSSGTVTGARFYKSTANTGTHVATLWSATGATLATGTFSGETASGWQTVTFATPVAVTAGTTYVVSYSAPNGHYAATGSFFTAAYTSGPLTAPSDTNGVYAYGTGSRFPSSTYNSSNYWVDPVFTTGNAPPPPTQTTVGDAAAPDFAAGTIGTGAYRPANPDGQVVLQPGLVTEFGGSALPTGFTSVNRTGGSTAVAAGTATVLNADLTTTATFASGRSIETRASLGPNQSLGWVTSSNSSVAIAFAVSATGQLTARSNDGLFNSASTVVAASWPLAPHVYRVDWTASAVTLAVDGVTKYTHAFFTVQSNLRPQFSDTVTTDGGLSVDWVRVSPYAASGVYASRVFDATTAAPWGALTWDAAVPAGSTLLVRARTGATASPDSTWSAYTTVATSGASIGRTARYMQYQLTLTSSGSRFVTPAVRSVTATVG